MNLNGPRFRLALYLFFNSITIIMKQKFLLRNCLLAVFMLSIVTACQKQDEPENMAADLAARAAPIKAPAMNGASGIATAHEATAELLKSVRAATSRFNSTTQAVNAGYEVNNHCVSVPGLGGMGYHWGNGSLIDPVFDVLKPEVILYEKGPGGNMRLTAVEYIVINVGQARPMFGDHPFDIGGTPVPVAHWSLHVWVHKENPNGVFTRFNPTVSCP